MDTDPCLRSSVCVQLPRRGENHRTSANAGLKNCNSSAAAAAAAFLPRCGALEISGWDSDGLTFSVQPESEDPTWKPSWFFLHLAPRPQLPSHCKFQRSLYKETSEDRWCGCLMYLFGFYQKRGNLTEENAVLRKYSKFFAQEFGLM